MNEERLITALLTTWPVVYWLVRAEGKRVKRRPVRKRLRKLNRTWKVMKGERKGMVKDVLRYAPPTASVVWASILLAIVLALPLGLYSLLGYALFGLPVGRAEGAVLMAAVMVAPVNIATAAARDFLGEMEAYNKGCEKAHKARKGRKVGKYGKA